MECFKKTALGIEHGGNDDADAHQHDTALDKVIDGSGHIAAGDHIDTCKDPHQNDADGVIHVERHAEKPGETVEQGGRVGNQKDKDDDGGADLQRLALKSLTKELGHGGGIIVLG